MTAPTPERRAAWRRRAGEFAEAWTWHEETDDLVAGYGHHMSQMLYRLPRDGQTADMRASIEQAAADLLALLDALDAAESERDEALSVISDTEALARLRTSLRTDWHPHSAVGAIRMMRAEAALARVEALADDDLSQHDCPRAAALRAALNGADA